MKRFKTTSCFLAIFVLLSFSTAPFVFSSKALPDLSVQSISGLPASVFRGGSFSITDSIANNGNKLSKAFTVRYYLSLDTIKGKKDILLTGNRRVKSLNYQITSSDDVNLKVPKKTPFNQYYLLACADDKKKIKESNEKNNCMASGTTINVTYTPSISLIQKSNIGINQSDAIATHVNNGLLIWDDYIFKAKIMSKDNDTVGLLFRYQDNNNYYAFHMGNETGSDNIPQVRIAKVVGGVNEWLQSFNWQYEEGLWYEIKIVLNGQNIAIYRDNNLIFNINDSTFSSGKIGLGSAWNEGAYFDDIEVTSLDGLTTLFSDNFNYGDMVGWTIFDEPTNTDDGPSLWSVN